MANVTRVPVNFLVSKGQGVKVQAQLYAAARSAGYILPYIPVRGNGEVAFEGAHVFEPKRGYYEEPIVTLDFASLYPSIMQAHNLCYSTHLLKGPGDLAPNQYVKTPNGDCFVVPEVRKGLLPQILSDLLTARKEAKKAMFAEMDPFKKSVLDGRQLALKVSANSGRFCAHQTSPFLGRTLQAHFEYLTWERPTYAQITHTEACRVICIVLNAQGLIGMLCAKDGLLHDVFN